ncbi:MAG: TetR/AcrR family transcriptional regulator C-terminal domain-containing protein [Christensenellales bacterium]
MKHEVTSLNTKKTLAEALKRAMTAKPLSKVTVSEIINDCGVNRKTFYYHFEDIYALLKWMLEQEAIEVVKNFDLLVNPEEALAFVIDYVDTNKHIINCAYDSMGRDEMKRFFLTDLYGVVRSIIDSVADEIGALVDDDFKDFLTTFYTEALAGMLINYFRGSECRGRQELIDYILLILRNSIPNVIRSTGRKQGTVS